MNSSVGKVGYPGILFQAFRIGSVYSFPVNQVIIMIFQKCNDISLLIIFFCRSLFFTILIGYYILYISILIIIIGQSLLFIIYIEFFADNNGSNGIGVTICVTISVFLSILIVNTLNDFPGLVVESPCTIKLMVDSKPSDLIMPVV